jgi:hypothetical protein
MRRLLAILLIAAFGFPAVAPLFAQGQDLESHLPACCRRNGAHHCAMGDTSNSNAPTVSERCPSFPQPGAVASHLRIAALTTTQPLIKLPLATQSATARAETQRRLSRERTRQKRGPPAALLAA